MNDIGQKRQRSDGEINSARRKAKKGRPKKKPEYRKEKAISEFIEEAVMLFGEPYDDRGYRPTDQPTILSVAEKMGTTPVRVRKLLITAGYFSTEISRKVSDLFETGMSMQDIMQQTGLGEASIYSYLPYSKGVYNLENSSLKADQGRVFRRRQHACRELLSHRGDLEEDGLLWEAILAFEHYSFRDARGLPLRYTITEEQLCFNRDDCIVSKQEIFRLYHDLDKEVERNQSEQQRTLGASCIYSIFLRFGLFSQPS